MTKDTEEASPTVTRRYVLMGGAALAVVAAAGGAGYYLWTQPDTAVAQAAGGGAEVPIGGLMTPGPLGDQAQGAANAPVTIIEYASMTCPHCSHFHETTFPELKKRYIDTGKVRFIFREFPLDPLAAGASMLARCADKEKFYPLIETLFAQQTKWAVERSIPQLMAIAKQAGMSEQTFNACLSDQKMLDAMQAEQK